MLLNFFMSIDRVVQSASKAPLLSAFQTFCNTGKLNDLTNEFCEAIPNEKGITQADELFTELFVALVNHALVLILLQNYFVRIPHISLQVGWANDFPVAANTAKVQVTHTVVLHHGRRSVKHALFSSVASSN